MVHPDSPWMIDPDSPTVARVYDYLLGGKDNFAADRQLGRAILDAAPDARRSATVNRAFGTRVTRFLARQGVRQFIDLGSGIPTTPPSVHETARVITGDDVKVVYVDHDPIVAAHSRALRDAPGTVTILADIGDPGSILDSPELLGHIDFQQPVAVLCLSVLQTITDQRDAVEAVAGFAGPLVPGSWLAVSHLSADRSVAGAVANVRACAKAARYPPFTARTDKEAGKFFDGFDLVDPGLVDVGLWRPDSDADCQSPSLALVGGVGVKT